MHHPSRARSSASWAQVRLQWGSERRPSGHNLPGVKRCCWRAVLQRPPSGCRRGYVLRVPSFPLAHPPPCRAGAGSPGQPQSGCGDCTLVIAASAASSSSALAEAATWPPSTPATMTSALERAGHHRDPLPAADRVEDVLCLFDCLRRVAAEQPRVPGLPWAARLAAGDQPEGRQHVLMAGLAIRRRSPQRPAGTQNYFCPGPAEGLPDQPVRPSARVTRLADLRNEQTARSRSASLAPISRRTRPSSCTRPVRMGEGQPRRLPSLRRADGDRDRTRCSDRW